MGETESWLVEVKFRKKPIIIEAIQYTGNNHIEVVKHLAEWEATYSLLGGVFRIVTPEGEMRVNESDWIIRGIMGEVYPCRADIFKETYVPVDDRPELDFM